MIEIEEEQARLILRIMNSAAFHWSDAIRRSPVMDHIEALRAKLEGQVGTVTGDLTP